MRSFETTINLAGNWNGWTHKPTSSTLEQHCSAMRMDDAYSWTGNQLIYAIADVKKDIERLTSAGSSA